jgi:rhamnose transport system permease protein
MSWKRHLVLIAMLVAVTAGFALRVEGFWDSQNVLDNTRYWFPLMALAVAMTPIIVTGGIDLSVGSLTALAGVAMGVLWQAAGWPLPLAVAAALVTGLLGGLANALLIVKGRISPLIVTLATLAAYRGLTTGISRGNVVRGFPDAFTQIGQGYLLGLTTQLWLMVALVLAGFVFVHLTWPGRAAYAIGVNERAARFAGLPVDGLKWVLYGASGLVAGLVAVVDVAHFDAASPQRGNLLELQAITVVVLGGTRITGGAGSVVGTALAALVICVLTYGARMAEFRDQALIGVLGGLLVVTAVLNELLARRTRSQP